MSASTMVRPSTWLDRTLARHESIGLDELNAAAALQTRVDRKYALDRESARRVLEQLDGATRVLELDSHRALAYESVYFDTPDLLSYRLAATGRRRRFKLRTRAYLDSDLAFLELKTRGGRSTTVKERIEYAIDNRERLTAEGRRYTDTGLDALGIPNPDALELVPTIVTRYDRTTLLLPHGDGRATVDTSLAWVSASGTRLERPAMTIIETKSAHGASALDRLLWAQGHRPDRISKFATGLAALTPHLPANKWVRVLRRHFT